MIARLAALTVALLAFAAVPVVAQPAFPEGIADTSFAEADGDRVIRLSVLVAAPSDQVWTALTTEGGWRQRMGVGFAKIDFRIGAVAGPVRPAPRAAHRTVTAMKTVGHGGAARKPEPVAAEDGWEEF